MRATADDVPMRFGEDWNHGALMERLTVKIEPGPQNHVPVPPLAAGSLPPGQPSGPPGWLQDIASMRLVFSAGVSNDWLAAPSVVSVMRWASLSARIIALVMK